MPQWLVIVNRAAGRAPVSVDDVALALAAAGVDGRIEVPTSRVETAEVVGAAALEGTTHFAVAAS